MMEREWAALLARYGQSVALHRGEETVRTQAFLQPVTERDRAQEAPSPLGLRREDRFLYLGKPEEPLTPGCWVEWNGTGYEVQTAHPIQAGGRTSHVWAVLRPRDREAGARAAGWTGSGKSWQLFCGSRDSKP